MATRKSSASASRRSPSVSTASGTRAPRRAAIRPKSPTTWPAASSAAPELSSLQRGAVGVLAAQATLAIERVEAAADDHRRADPTGLRRMHVPDPPAEQHGPEQLYIVERHDGRHR